MKLFVTATGTDIGKTFITCALLRHTAGLRALKPVLSGYDPATPEHSDPALLLAAQTLAATPHAIEAIAPFRYAAPLSPDMAARAEHRVLDYGSLLAFCRAAPAPVLIEGVGGVMAPLTATRTVLNWIADLGTPALLVAGSALGSLSHTLTALAVLRVRNVPVVAVVVNESADSTVDLEHTATSLREHAGAAVFTLRRHADAAAQGALAASITSAWAGSRSAHSSGPHGPASDTRFSA